MKKPPCHKCVYHRSVAGDAHISCLNYFSNVVVNKHGFDHSWAYWPINFDPIWIEECDNFCENQDNSVFVHEDLSNAVRAMLRMMKNNNL